MTSGPECIEGRLVADFLLTTDIHLDLIHRDVSGPFDHHLHVELPRALGELAERVELGELRLVARVVQASGPERIAERDGDVVLAKDVEDVIVMLVQRILFAMVHHPHRVQRAAAADDPRDATVDERQMLQQNPGVQRHVVDALASLMLDDFEEVVDRELLELLPLQHRLIDRHRADRHRRRADDRLARDVDVLAGGEVHDGIGAVLHREQELVHLFIYRRGDGGVPDVRVDFDGGDLADGHGLEGAGEVVYVRGDYEAAAGDLGSDELRGEGFALGDELHRGGDFAGAREGHLRAGGTWCRYGHRSTPYAGANRIRFNGTLSALAAEVRRGTPVCGGILAGSRTGRNGTRMYRASCS